MIPLSLIWLSFRFRHNRPVPAVYIKSATTFESKNSMLRNPNTRWLKGSFFVVNMYVHSGSSVSLVLQDNFTNNFTNNSEMTAKMTLSYASLEPFYTSTVYQ